jgi:uncharacterized membrane protein
MPDVSAFCPACGRSMAVHDSSEKGSRQRALGVLAYMAVLPAIILVAIPPLRGSRFVRFHAWQSILFSVSTVIVASVLRLLFLLFSMFPFIGFLIAWLLLGIGTLGIVTLWVVLVAKAVQGECFELPVIGSWAARLTS